jgi:hypothetical protein
MRRAVAAAIVLAASSPALAAERPPARPDGVQRALTVSLNPLPIAAGRYGANVEIVAAPHHAVVASGFLQTFPRGMIELLVPSGAEIGTAPASMPGGELGYRLYTSGASASGLFVGPSFVLMPIAYPRVREDLKVDVDTLLAYGGALDAGAQVVTSSGFTFGGGLGAMVLAYTPPRSYGGVAFAEPHVLPRLLLMTGWSF